jgi:hypothetical protein
LCELVANAAPTPSTGGQEVDDDERKPPPQVAWTLKRGREILR